MGKRPTKSATISLSTKLDPRPDKNVFIPHQVKHAAAAADALATGHAAPPKPKSNARPGFPHTDAEIDEALQRLEKGALQISDPEFKVIRDLAEEGARHIRSRRRGAGGPRGTSDGITRRMEALLQAYRELSPKLQAHPNGVTTVRALRQAAIKKLGLTDDDDVLSEDTVKKAMQGMRPIFRLVRKGIVPPPGPKPGNRKMIAGKRALAKQKSGQ